MSKLKRTKQTKEVTTRTTRSQAASSQKPTATTKNKKSLSLSETTNEKSNNNTKRRTARASQAENANISRNKNKKSAATGVSKTSQRIKRDRTRLSHNVHNVSIRRILYRKLTRKSASSDNAIVTLNGAEFVPDEALKFSRKGGIRYALYPLSNPRYKTGIVLIKPGGVKRVKKTLVNLKYSLMCGSLQFIFDNKTMLYKQQDVISIPKGVPYGLKNPTNKDCFLTFFSY